MSNIERLQMLTEELHSIVLQQPTVCGMERLETVLAKCLDNAPLGPEDKEAAETAIDILNRGLKG